MSVIGFNPAVNAARAANQTVAADAQGDKRVAPPFVRADRSSSEGVKARTLDEFTQINGMIPRLGAAREGLKGSVDKLKESLGNGDVKGAQAQLDRISTYNLDHLFKTDGINPNIFKELKVALTLRATSAQILKEVDRVLDKNGFKPSGPQNW